MRKRGDAPISGNTVLVKLYHVSPGLVNPKPLFNWEATIFEATIFKYQIMTIDGIPNS